MPLKALSAAAEISDDFFTTNKTLIAGGVAGSVAKTATAPLSRLTILYQVSSLIAPGSSGSSAHGLSPSLSSNVFESGVFGAFQKLVRQEGFFALWKGNFTSVLHRFPYSAINFTAFERCRLFLVHQYHLQETSAVRFVCGAVAGTTACVCCYPLDLLRTRLSIVETSACGNKPAGIFNSLAQIIQDEGIYGLYRGVSISLAVAVPNLALGFAVYGAMKDKLLDLDTDLFRDKTTGRINSIGSMLGGGVSGLCTSALTFPMDVIRRRLQVQGILTSVTPYSRYHGPETTHIDAHTPLHTNGADTLTKDAEAATSANSKASKPQLQRHSALAEARILFQNEGARGFYRGIVPELLKVIPMISITFCTYEFVLDQLTKQSSNKKKKKSDS